MYSLNVFEKFDFELLRSEVIGLVPPSSDAIMLTLSSFVTTLSLHKIAEFARFFLGIPLIDCDIVC